MWMVNPKLLCRQHLLGEHNELHKVVGHIRKGNEEVVKGHARKGQIDTSKIRERHEELVAEMERRGYNHNSELDYEDNLNLGEIDRKRNLQDLKKRCDSCREKIDKTDKLF